MNGNFIVAVANKEGTVVEAKTIKRSKYGCAAEYEKAIARCITKFEHKYGDKGYLIHQGTASDVASFLTVYPELVQQRH